MTETNITIIEYHGQRVLTTKQLAESYETTELRIRQNFLDNQERYREGVHYFKLEGDDLRAFKHRVGNCYSVDPRVNALTLWTERGCLHHAKTLGTNKAWEVFELLEDTYFRVEKLGFGLPAADSLPNDIDAAIGALETDITCQTHKLAVLQQAKQILSGDGATDTIVLPASGAQNTLGERLYKLRRDRGLSRETVTYACRVNNADTFSQSTLASYESGRARPSLRRLIALARFYGVLVDDLVGGTNPSDYEPLKIARQPSRR